MHERPVVLLGEVHDNAAQHAVRLRAVEQLLRDGLRPALAFEQLDRGSQPEIDRLLAQPPVPGEDVAGRIAALGPRGWDWKFYRPFLELAVKYHLPVVAADLSSADAMRVGEEGFGAAFDPAAQRELGLDPLPPALLRAQERAVDEGHCHQMPAQMLPAVARAQIARDATLARSIQPYLQRGVILLTGNGHIRRDIAVPHFLPPAERSRVISIALIERDTPRDEIPAGAYDVVFRTPVQAREDPCKSLKLKRMQ